MSSTEHGATAAEALAAFAVSSGRAPLPEDVARSVGQRIVDIVGIATAATRLETSAATTSYVLDHGGRPDATVIGSDVAVPAAMAALANGTLAHSLDYDDTHLPSVLHPSASVVPAALAAAEAVGADGASTIHAIAVGLEVCIRVGMAGYDQDRMVSVYFDRGQHATSMCGALGSAVAAGLLYGLDESQLVSALGVAASMASGIIEANRTGGTVKRIHCGWAAHSGVTAAELVRRGLTGPPTVFEGRFGFFEAFLSGWSDLSAIYDGLGTEWTVPGIAFKPYPANHFTHAGIDAALAIRAQGITPNQIASAHLGVASAPLRTIGEPLAIKQAPETGYQAQFSGPYTVAAALFGGGGLGLGLEDFTDELAQAPERRALMSRITVGPDERCDAIFPMQFPGVLTVRTTAGDELVEEVLVNRGTAGRPLSDEELGVKFTDNVRGLLSTEQGGDLLGGLRALVGPAPAAARDALTPVRRPLPSP